MVVAFLVTLIPWRFDKFLARRSLDSVSAPIINK